MKLLKSTLLGLYAGAVPEVDTMVLYNSLVQRRWETYRYIERYRQLPVFAMLSKETHLDDLKQHYSSKLAAAASPENIEEFVAGEIALFRLRLQQASDSDVYKLFICEYLQRLKHPFTYHVQDSTITVTIDKKDELNWIGQINSTELVHEVMVAYTKTKGGSILVHAHFTKHYSIQGNNITDGFICSGVAGIRSILLRGFHDLLRNTLHVLYLSDVPKKYIVSRPVVSVESMKLQTSCIPQCISKILSKLKIKRHLKYNDRSNLNNFLNSTGVPIEDVFSLYKTNFSCSSSDFEKKYKYSIQHAYGLVGGRIKYKETPCAKFISETGKGDCAGCPFAENHKDPQRECAKQLEKLTKKPESTTISPTEYYLKAVRSAAQIKSE